MKIPLARVCSGISLSIATALFPAAHCKAACVTPPSGLVSWWAAEGDANDSLGANNGSAMNGVNFDAGTVGRAFSLTGGAHIRVPDSASLDFSNAITIEGWIFPTDASAYHDIVSKWDMVGANQRSFAVGILPDGTFGFTLAPYGTTASTSLLQSTNHIPVNQWTHFAGTYDGSTMKLYINGVLQNQVAYNLGIFQGTDALGIGATIGDGAPGQYISAFLGKIDEISLYNRGLSDAEVQSIFAAGADGKCSTPVAPTIVSQPANQTGTVGGTATFKVGASGSAPLSYQWLHEGTNLPGATASSLTLTNVQMSDAGIYAVTVTNSAGSATSSNATLTLTLPPAAVRLGSTNAPAGANVTIPVTIVANGNENAIGFSIVLDPSLLSFVSAGAGSATTGAAFLVNTNQLPAGKLGLAIALNTGDTLPAGTQEIAQITFTTAIVTTPTDTIITFGDAPIGRQLTDVNGHVLPASYSSGTTHIAAAEFEADVFPRPGGDRDVTISDWVLVGRYVAQLDSPTNDNEFQRADCAPRSTRGNGNLTVADWVQAGRYAARLDPLTVLGGPSTPGPVPPPAIKPNDLGQRDVRVSNNQAFPAEPGTVSVLLNSQGDENAVGFTIGFNPGALRFVSAVLGSNASGATLNVNTNQVPSGFLGIALARSFGTSFTAGTNELLKLNFKASTAANGSYPISLNDQIVRREVSDANASVLTSSYTPGAIAVTQPLLTITTSGQTITLSWPVTAGDYGLQEAPDLTNPSTWAGISPTVITNGNQISAVLPLGDGPKFYRLMHP